MLSQLLSRLKKELASHLSLAVLRSSTHFWALSASNFCRFSATDSSCTCDATSHWRVNASTQPPSSVYGPNETIWLPNVATRSVAVQHSNWTWQLAFAVSTQKLSAPRSEERRVGKEWRSRWSA